MVGLACWVFLCFVVFPFLVETFLLYFIGSEKQVKAFLEFGLCLEK